MAKPYEVRLTKKQQNQVMSIFLGKSKDFPVTKDSRVIANCLHLPRYDVMYFLEQRGYKEYSIGSYY